MKRQKVDKGEAKSTLGSSLKRIIATSMIITNLCWSIPIVSFAADNEDDSDETREAIVPAIANQILSEYISTSISGAGSSSSSDTSTYEETGDGYYSLTKVNGKVYKNYRQNLVSYAYTQDYYGNKFAGAGCGPTSLAIIASGYGIDKTPGDIAKIITDDYGDLTSVNTLSHALDDIGIKHEAISQNSNSNSTKIEKIRSNLKSGNPVAIAVNNPGDGKYSSGGHWMAILAIDDNDNITISNPWRTLDAEHINGDNGGVGDKGTTTTNLSDFINTYTTRCDYILITQSSSSATSNSSSTSSNSSTSSSSSNNSSLPSKGEGIKCDPHNDGYDSIYTNRYGRKFKEFKQNIDGYYSWNNKNYPISHLEGCDESGWNSECGTVSTGIIGSGYKYLSFQDVANELISNSGVTSFPSFLSDFTGQNVSKSSVSSIDEFANALANGSVAVIHDWNYSGRGHYLAVLDISKDKSQIYISNPDVNNSPSDKAIYQGWNEIQKVYDAIEKNEIYFVTNDGSTVDYTGSGAGSSSSTSNVKVANNIVAKDGGGYKVDIDLNKVVDKMIKVVEENTDFKFEKYLSSKNRKKYLKNFLKAAIATQYPDLRTADEIANNKPIPDDEVQGCIRIKRYIDTDTKNSFVKAGLTNPKDSDDGGMYLTYMPYEKFDQLIKDEDTSAMRYFSIDSSNNMVVAGWETMEVTTTGPYQTNIDEVGAADSSIYGEISYTPKNQDYQRLTMKSVDYLSQVSNYVMPFNLLWTLLVYSNDEDFANDVAELVIGSDIVMGCYDATQTVVTNYTDTFSKEGIATYTVYRTLSGDEMGKTNGELETKTVTVEYKFKATETDTLKTDTPTLKLKHADIWTAVYDVDYKVDYDTSHTDNNDNPTTLPDENIGTNYYQKRDGKYTGDRTIDDDNLATKVDNGIDTTIEESLEELQEEVDKANESLSFRYAIINKVIQERFSNKGTDIYNFFSIKQVQNVIINMIINQSSSETIEKAFSFSKNQAVGSYTDDFKTMQIYAKQVASSISYAELLDEASDYVRGLVSDYGTDSDLYNELTQNGKNRTTSYTISGISSTQITVEAKTTNQIEIVETDTTNATVNEVVTSDSKVRMKIDVNSDEGSFVKLLYNSPEANTNLYVISYWFFDSMESTARIADFADLMRYLFQHVYNRDYGVSTDMSDYVDIFDPEEFHVLNSNTSSQGENSSDFVTYIAGWETPEYNDMSINTFTVKVDMEGDLYIGPGIKICTGSSGGQSWYPDITGQTIYPGQTFSRDIVDKIYQSVIDIKRNIVKKVTAKLGITLTQCQEDAMTSFAYNMCNAESEVETCLRAYGKNKNLEAFKNVFMQYVNSNGERLEGLVKRRESEYNLFANGIYDSTH